MFRGKNPFRFVCIPVLENAQCDQRDKSTAEMIGFVCQLRKNWQDKFCMFGEEYADVGKILDIEKLLKPSSWKR